MVNKDTNVQIIQIIIVMNTLLCQYVSEVLPSFNGYPHTLSLTREVVKLPYIGHDPTNKS